MFGTSSIVNANKSAAFKEQAEDLSVECENALKQLGRHFQQHIEPALRQYMFEPR